MGLQNLLLSFEHRDRPSTQRDERLIRISPSIRNMGPQALKAPFSLRILAIHEANESGTFLMTEGMSLSERL